MDLHTHTDDVGEAQEPADLRNTDRGASVVEYALLVALIAVVCVAAVGFLGGSVSSSFETAVTEWDAQANN
ncbi:MAG: Flp family type IVb pilin [Acidimicrobiales bacterium]